jgi:hypothetical protein
MNSTTLSAEKRGSAHWVQCAGCAGWFPIGNSLLVNTKVKLHCPHCHEEFFATEAKRLARAS